MDQNNIRRFSGKNDGKSPLNNKNNNRKDQHNQPTNECAICLEGIINLAIANECNHSFCFECISEWVRLHNRCPICRKIIHTVRYNITQTNDCDLLEVTPPVIHPEFVFPISEQYSILSTPEHSGLYIISPVRQQGRQIHYETHYIHPMQILIIRNNDPGTLFVLPEDYGQVIRILESVGIYRFSLTHRAKHPLFFRNHKRH